VEYVCKGFKLCSQDESRELKLSRQTNQIHEGSSNQCLKAQLDEANRRHTEELTRERSLSNCLHADHRAQVASLKLEHKKKVAQLEAQMQAQTAACERLRNELGSAEVRMKEAGAKAESLPHKERELQRTVPRLERENRELRGVTRADEVTKQAVEMTAEVEAEKVTLPGQEAALTRMVKRTETENRKLDKLSAELRAKNCKLEEENARVQRQLAEESLRKKKVEDELQAKNRELEEENARVQRQLAEESLRNKKVEDELQAKNRELEQEVIKESTAKRTALQDAADKEHRLQNDVDKLALAEARACQAENEKAETEQLLRVQADEKDSLQHQLDAVNRKWLQEVATRKDLESHTYEQVAVVQKLQENFAEGLPKRARKVRWLPTLISSKSMLSEKRSRRVSDGLEELTIGCVQYAAEYTEQRVENGDALWEWHVGGDEYRKYPREVAIQLESAYRSNADSKVSFMVDQVHYVVEFQAQAHPHPAPELKQMRSDDHSRRRTIRRRDTIGSDAELCRMIRERTLPAGQVCLFDRVYDKDVFALFEQMLSKTQANLLGTTGGHMRHPWPSSPTHPKRRLKLVDAWQIDNPTRLTSYEAGVKIVKSDTLALEKAGIRTTSNQHEHGRGSLCIKVQTDETAFKICNKADGVNDLNPDVNEKLLFHGTAPDRVLDILTIGFEPAATAGAKHGAAL
ncbi:MAG: hypothetical protein SGPRY_005392, partial [Prymnesium sp.]